MQFLENGKLEIRNGFLRNGKCVHMPFIEHKQKYLLFNHYCYCLISIVQYKYINRLHNYVAQVLVLLLRALGLSVAYEPTSIFAEV